MGRHKLSGPDPVKVSVLISPELNRQVEDLAAHRRCNKSDAFRHFLELGIDAEQRQEDPRSVASPISLPGSGHEGVNLTIELTAELRDCIQLAARLHGLQPAALVQQMVGEHVAAWIAKGHERQEEFRRLVNEGQQEP
jgi:hypothetical protein